MNILNKLKFVSTFAHHQNRVETLQRFSGRVNAAAHKHFAFIRHSSSEFALQSEQQEEADKLYKMIEIELRAYEPAVLKSYEWFARTAAKHLEITVANCWSPPKPHHDRRSLLKSVHIYKKHQVQYEVRTYFKFMQFKYLTGSTADTFLEYVQRNLPEGVGMKVTKVEIKTLPEHLKPPPSAGAKLQLDEKKS